MEDPHFSYPFRLRADGAAAVVQEGGTDADALDQVEVLLRTERGSREEVPEYGIPDQAFREGGADLELIQEAVSDWAPTADGVVTHVELSDMTDRIRVEVRARD